jgi:hypothetical protein
MTKQNIRLVAGAVAALLATACVDLEVVNPNEADTDRALRTPSDIEALVASGWGTWWSSQHLATSAGSILMTASYQHSSVAANWGMVEFSGFPKAPVHYLGHQVFYDHIGNTWTRIYRAVAAAVQGMQAAEDLEFSAADRARLRAYGYYVLGLAHGSNSILYDQGYIYDPTMDGIEDAAIRPYQEVNEAALGYLGQAIAEIEAARAAGITFTIPQTWMSRTVTRDELEDLAYSMRARYRAAVARTPAERAAVNWAAVQADVDRGVTADWSVQVASTLGFSPAFDAIIANTFRYGPWGQLSYMVLGMADQSGSYQRWLDIPVGDRHPMLVNQTDDPFLIITPDTRFAQGATIAAQTASPGRIFEIPTAAGGYGSQWNSPARGTFRWSFYRTREHNMWLGASASRTTHVEIPLAEMRGLLAEALYRQGNLDGAAALVNVSRTGAGLNATDATGTNTSCVPRLPSGECGNLWEMLKWEVRLETMYRGMFHSPWYFHSRGWGDLAEGTFLQFPVPGSEAFLLGITEYTFGGPGNDGSAPLGTYGY